MNYLSQMNEAIARAARLEIRTPHFEPQSGRMLNDKVHQDLPYIVRDAMGEATIEDVAAQCLSYHIRLLPILSDYFGSELTYTIGYISMGAETIFEHTESQMKELIASRISQPQLNIHAWLTLPTCEIMDFTLPTTFAMVNKTGEGYGAVLTGHADHLLNAVRYHPMLLGEDYLRKIGALLEFQVIH